MKFIAGIFDDECAADDHKIYLFLCFRSVTSMPKEFAHMIRSKFGSADNIKALGMSGMEVCVSR